MTLPPYVNASDGQPYPLVPEDIDSERVLLCLGGPLNGDRIRDVGPTLVWHDRGIETDPTVSIRPGAIYDRHYIAPPDRTPTTPPGENPATSGRSLRAPSYSYVYVLRGLDLTAAEKRLGVLLEAPR